MTTPQEWRRSTFLLVALFVGIEVLANWAAAAFKWSLGPLLIPAGAFCIPVSLLLRDGLHLNHPRAALGVAMIGGAVVSAMFSWEVARIAFAAVCAFLISFAVDTWVFDKLHDRSPVRRMRVSNWASLPVDTLVFVPLAFGGLFPLGALIAGQLIAKLVMTEVAIVVYVAVRQWRRVVHESVR